MKDVIDIHGLEAGPETDALVAQYVMGLNVEWMNGQPCHWTERTPTAKDYHLIPRYSTDIATAFKVLERLGQPPRSIWLHELTNRWENSWRCVLSDKSKWYQDWGAETAPLAICRAALDTV